MENNEIINFEDVEVMDMCATEETPGISTGVAIAIGAGLACAVGAGIQLAKKLYTNYLAKKEAEAAEDNCVDE